MLRSRRFLGVAAGSATAATAVAVLATASVATASASPAASVSGGNVSVGWSLPGVPAGGVSNITFPMTIGPSTLEAAGTYFAQQIAWTNISSGGYIGLQPRPPVNGQARLHAAFSSFIAGTTSTDSQCSNGADGGAGVSCAADFNGVYGDTYAMTVTNTGPDTWTGTATDTDTGVSSHIGTFTLPAGSGGLTGSFGGFIENYLDSPSCSQVPYVDVTFGGPTSTDAGGLKGTTVNNDEYNGDCLGQENYNAVTVGSGTRITRGWIANGTGSPSASAAPSATSTGSGGSLNGSHALTLAGIGESLDDPNSSTSAGQQLDTWSTTGGQNQSWTFTQQPDGSYAITNASSQLCMDDSGSSTAAGGAVIQYPCTGNPNQHWALNAQSNGTYIITNVYSKLALTTASSSNGALVTQQADTGSPLQEWTLG